MCVCVFECVLYVCVLCVCVCMCVVVPAARVAVKRYKFYVYYTLIMRVYKQITFMAQSTRSNRHRQQWQGQEEGKTAVEASSALVPCSLQVAAMVNASLSLSLFLCLHGVSMELTSQLPINVARMRTQIIW